MIRRTGPALLLDVVAVLLFAALGRASHDEGGAVAGTLGIAAPFLGALLFGWVMSWLFEKRPALSVGDGVSVWVVTVAAGMTIRHLAGRGTAWPFIVVTALTLALLLLGWRAVSSSIIGRR